MPDNDTLVALSLFAFVGAFTPGPNNLMVLASGTAFGFSRTVPHILGVTFGFAVMLLAFGIGLGRFFQAYPALHETLRLAGAAYLLYFAWRIARAGDPGAAPAAQRPLTFLEAALFQWVNVKALTLAVGVVAAFTRVGGNLARELAAIVSIFSIATVLTLVTWCGFGLAIRRLFASPRALRLVNGSLALMLAFSVVLLFV
ncbi:MAG TPA: LysE family translocator [Xanthobacteraceae bacterium]|nr:LysE family translocator [Xanthobacteraceae bacterium]